MADRPTRDLESTLAKSGIEVGGSEDIDAGRLYEFAPNDIDGARGFAVLGEDETHLGMRLELPHGSPLRGSRPDAPDALLMLGSLSAAFSGYGFNARLVTGDSGLEAVMLTKRRCGRLDKQQQEDDLAQLIDAASMLRLELASDAIDTLFERLQQRRVPDGISLLDVEQDERPEIVPSFDPATRDRLLGR